jgi:creatinine amidohydrolase
MQWAEQNTTRLGELSRKTVCVLPVGAIEQHGPHLPVATDRIIAEAITERLDAACENKLLLMPSLGVTCSEHHMAFPGTLSIDHELFLAMILEEVRSASRHGYRRFFLLNAHGGNIAIGGVVAEQAAARFAECDVVFATWFRVAAEKLRPLAEGSFPAVGHACEFETSLIMAVRPDLVRRHAIVDDGIAPASALLRADLLTSGPAARALPFEKMTKSGVFGKPSLASPEKGRAILDLVVPAIKELLQAYWPDAPGIGSPAST